jgi:short subunit dehydrogenase-like uncharacterized protein
MSTTPAGRYGATVTDFLLLGANGYVGRAAATLAAERGLRPVLGGRDAPAVTRLAVELGLDARVVDPGDAAAMDAALGDVPLVLSCAGPFVHTYLPVVEACLRSGTHYLDITGEPPVYDGIAALHDRAVAAGVMLLPSVGFDILASDCLAAHLVRRLPTATRLTLAIRSRGPADLPPGTLATLIEMTRFGSNKQHRVDGRVVAASTRPIRRIDFGDGPVEAAMITWGDVWGAYRSTGIPNIQDYMVLPAAMRTQLDLIDRVRPLFRIGPVRSLAKRLLRGGATAEERARTSTTLFGEVTDPAGERAVSRLHGPEAGLEWTARAALDAVRRVLDGTAAPGFQTPSMVFGPDIAVETDGVTREDVE